LTETILGKKQEKNMKKNNVGNTVAIHGVL
jgi:hypothetical protein